MTSPSGLRVIVVEDDESLARLIIHCLRKIGFHVEHLHDGRAALALVERSDPPDLIVVDYLMPYADGLKVIRALRANAVWTLVPIICVTSTSHEDTMITGLRFQSDAFLTKPFRPSELIEAARRLITRKTAAS